MDEQRLPFPIAGTRTSGDGDPALGRGDAARLLYLVNLIADTAGVPVYGLARQTPYGMVTASVHGPLAFKSIRVDEEEVEPEAEELPVGPARLVWLPEGFVITPRTPGAPDGFGMPPTPDGRGTPGGPLRQVIINRFKDNQYPDAVYRAAGGAEGGVVFAANLFFMDWEMGQGEFGIGITVGDGDEAQFRPQFSQRWVPNYREPESGSWHCHRPQLEPSQVPLEALARQEVNLVREQVAMPALGRPLRGRGGELSQNIAYQIRTSGAVEHDSPLFRDGHRSLGERALERSAFAGDVGENLNLRAPAQLDAEAVYGAIDGWVNSPGHYGNMIYDWAYSSTRYAWVDSAFTAAGNAVQPPTTGVVGVQIFHSADAEVDAAPGVHADRPPVGVVGNQDMFVPIYPQEEPRTDTFWPAVAYRGRTFYVTDTDVNVHSLRILSGTTLVEEEGETKLRLAALLRPQGGAGVVFAVVYEGAVHDFLNTKVEVSRYQLPQTYADKISIPTWSKSGKKAAFCFTTLSPVPPGRIQSGVSSPVPTTFVGQQLHFVEMIGDMSFHRGTDQLQIDPTDFGPQHRNSFCQGTARLLPAYEAEQLKYVSIEVDSYVRFSPTRFEKRIRGAMVFPGGRRIVYADQSSWDEFGGEQAPVSGFVRHILPFDVSDPDSVAYIQYDHPAQESSPGISARLVIRGDQVKYSPLAYDSGFSGMHYRTRWDFGSAEYTLDSFRGNPYWDPRASPGLSFFGYINDKYTPSVKFDGVAVGHPYPPNQINIGPRGSYVGPVPTSPRDTNYVFLGPVILADGVPVVGSLYQDGSGDRRVFQRVEQFRYTKYKGEWVYAGRIENTLGGTGEFTSEWPGPGNKTHFVRSAWLGDDQYYCHSSIDLKAITGLPDLKDNILPIGVL